VYESRSLKNVTRTNLKQTRARIESCGK